MESAERNSQRMNADGLQMNRVAQKSQKQPSREKPQTGCYRCGGTGHWAKDCHFKDAQSPKCRKMGHLAKVCCSGVEVYTVALKVTLCGDAHVTVLM